MKMIVLAHIFLMVTSAFSAERFDKFFLLQEAVSDLSAAKQISSGCRNELIQMWKYSEKSLFSWPWKILDASSKFPSGIEVMQDDIGQFDECIEAVNDHISGKYCLGNMVFSIPISGMVSTLNKTHHLVKSASDLMHQQSSVSLNIEWAGCLPSSCNAGDFEYFYNSIITRIVPEISVNFDDNLCSTNSDDRDLSPGAVFTIVFFGIIITIMLAQTCYDIYCQRSNKKPIAMLLAFSVYTNSKKIFKMTKGSNQLDCLNGLRFFSMLCVVLGHTYSFTLSSSVYSHLDLITWADSLHSMIIVNLTYSVDTFFLVGGVLIAYVYFQSMEKKVKFNLFMYYFHRYIRLTPALGALVLLVATIYPYFGNGPRWSNVRRNQLNCQDYWWTTIFYVGNYFAVGHLCVPHSWYLFVDMQLYLISPFILYAMRKYTKYTVIGLISTILAICIMDFFIAWNKHYLALLSNYYGDSQEFLANYYIKTHTRAGPWLMGILLGYVLFKIKQNQLRIKIQWVYVTTAWIGCFALLLTCILIGHDSLRTSEYNQWGNSLHIAFVRIFWSIGVCWVILACVSGYGGPINWFLSLPIYQMLNKLTYSVYLIHYMLMVCLFASVRTPILFSWVTVGYLFWGNLCFTTILAYFWVLAFESPMITLEKIILGPLLQPRK